MTTTHDPRQKIGAGHLARLAYLYVRPSTLRQVLENSESTKRQYALRERAVVLGWPRCVFRSIPISRSDGIRSVVPTIPISDSEVFDHRVMAEGAAVV